MTLAELQAQRDQLVAALGKPERRIRFEDRETERFSPEELLTAIAGIDSQIAAMSGSQESRVFVVASSGGYGGNGCCGGGDSFEVWR